MRIQVLPIFAFVAFASLAIAGDGRMPWAFVNGSATGYSIKLESASPPPGTPVTVGQTVEFKITVSFQLSIADTGSILMVVQDETNKNLLGDRKQQSQSVNRGKGTVALTDSLVVPEGGKEVRLFIPLVPDGLQNTSGELVIRYPVASPTADSIHELLEVLNFKSIFADLLERQKAYFRAELERDESQGTLNSTQRAILAEFHDRALSVIDDELRWTRFLANNNEAQMTRRLKFRDVVDPLRRDYSAALKAKDFHLLSDLKGLDAGG